MSAASLKLLSFLTSIQSILCQTFEFEHRTILFHLGNVRNYDEAVKKCADQKMYIAEPYYMEYNEFLLLKRPDSTKAVWIGLVHNPNTASRLDKLWRHNLMPLEGYLDWCDLVTHKIDDLTCNIAGGGNTYGILSKEICWKTCKYDTRDTGVVCEKLNPVQPNDVTVFERKKYYFYNTLANFFEARKLCILNNQNIFIIENQDLDRFLTNEVRRRNVDYWIHRNDLVINKHSTKFGDNFWTYERQVKLSYTNWCPDEQKRTRNLRTGFWCIYLNTNLNCWSTESCQYYRIGFICEDSNQLISPVESNDIQTFRLKRYTFYSQEVDFFEARALCSLNNQQLLVIETEGENRFITEEVAKRNMHHWLNLKNFVYNSLEFGLWNWDNTGQNLNYKNWCSNELNDKAYCAYYNKDSKCWGIESCTDYKVGFICQSDPTIVNQVEKTSYQDAVVFGENYYYFYSTPANFFEAKFLCDLNDQDLLTIENQELSNFMRDQVKNRLSHYWMDLKNFVSTPMMPSHWNWANKHVSPSFTNWCSADVTRGTTQDFVEPWCGYKNHHLNCWKLENCLDFRTRFICQGREKIKPVQSNDVLGFRGKRYIFYSDRVNFFEARGLCSMNNQELLIIEDEFQDIFIKDKVTKRNSHYWMNFKNFILCSSETSLWNWDNRREISKHTNWCLIDVNEERHRDFSRSYCAYYNRDLECWRMENCVEYKAGFICQADTEKIRIGEVDYFFHENYNIKQIEAKKICQENGQLLATLDDENTYNLLSSEINNRKSDFWIGLERYGNAMSGQFWRWPSTGYDTSLFKWCNPNDEDYTSYTCVYMIKDGCWKSANCDQTLVDGFICEPHDVLKKFHFHTEKVNYFQAYKNCITRNQELIMIDDAPLDVKIIDEAKKKNMDFWLGLKNFFHCESAVSFWHWNRTNEILRYRNWCPADIAIATDRSKDRCGYLDHESSCWKIQSCDSQIAYICEEVRTVNVNNPYCPVSNG